uniref:SCP domain-containing protein n=2 Tax=Clytia hemisphaerica TaxID=252671 RepID=A0A7M5X0L0_9CNID
MKKSFILILCLVTFVYGRESGSGGSGGDGYYECSCVDTTGDCDERYHCTDNRRSCPATCGECVPTLPPYHEGEHITPPEEIKEINEICASEHNKYDGVNLVFDNSIAHYSQLRAEYVVEQQQGSYQNVHDKCKLNLFPDLRWLVGNYMPFNEPMDLIAALKRAIQVWYEEVNNPGGDQSHYEAMIGHSLVGCGVASNGKITRVVVWYGTPKA